MKTLFRIIAGLLLVVVIALAAFVGANWAPDRPVSELQARWAPPPSVFVDVAGMNVHLRDEGRRDDAVPIVLVHGTSSSLHTWEGWTQTLKERRRVIRFDLPGFGLTGPAPDNNYSIDAYVRFMGTMFDKLGVQHCVLVGNSLGGQVAWETAVAMPSRVDKLILVDASGYPLQSKSVPIGFRIARTPVLNQLMEFTLPRSMIVSSLRNVYGNPDRLTPETVDRYYDLTLRAGNRHALAERFRQMSLGADADRIAKISQPTLILWGRQDRLIPSDHAERFHHDIAGSRIVMFDDLGHVPQEEDPARTVTAAQAFLE